MEKTKTRTAIAKFIDQLPKTGDSVSLNHTKEVKIGEDRIGESLIFELPSGKKVKFIAKLVDPKKCKIWNGNIRLQEYLSDENTSELREKIKTQGQLVPVLARPIKGDSEFTHEIIYGSRRHFVCSSMQRGIKILEADLEDEDALLFMDAENSGRQDMSSYEIALAYKFWLEKGIFKNQGELAEKLGITRSWLNKIISLSRIPKEVISAIGGPKHLSLKNGLELIKMLSKETFSEKKMFQKLKDLGGKVLTFEQLLNLILEGKNLSVINVKKKNSLNNLLIKTIFSSQGKPLCKIYKSKNEKTIIRIERRYSEERLQELFDKIEMMMQSQSFENNTV